MVFAYWKIGLMIINTLPVWGASGQTCVDKELVKVFNGVNDIRKTGT
jgi:hypothetical protein